MGNNNSNANMNSMLQSKFTFVKDLNDPRFGEINVWRDKVQPENMLFIKN